MEIHGVDYGRIEFKVKPENTRVYLDDKYLGTVNDLPHHEARLAGGSHDIRLVAPDERTVERTVYVAIGEKIKFNERLWWRNKKTILGRVFARCSGMAGCLFVTPGHGISSNSYPNFTFSSAPQII